MSRNTSDVLIMILCAVAIVGVLILQAVSVAKGNETRCKALFAVVHSASDSLAIVAADHRCGSVVRIR